MVSAEFGAKRGTGAEPLVSGSGGFLRSEAESPFAFVQPEELTNLS